MPDTQEMVFTIGKISVTCNLVVESFGVNRRVVITDGKDTIDLAYTDAEKLYYALGFLQERINDK